MKKPQAEAKLRQALEFIEKAEQLVMEVEKEAPFACGEGVWFSLVHIRDIEKLMVTLYPRGMMLFNGKIDYDPEDYE